MNNALDNNHTGATPETTTLQVKIETVMGEARLAAVEAFANYAATAEKKVDGSIAAPAGGAYVYAVKPSHTFKLAMMDAGEMESSLSGRWNVGRFQDVVEDRSIIAAEIACAAALKVLRAHFPDETFASTSYLT